ncbi:hypothetical protein Tcan_03691 [Toxocara canis]|uniref:Uncharacterized protein n=1 Tax=Toxocara canis TaxID=6265 RepID=A0A0B2VT60_TOXCA|nr:hypothetical protein Tcan_03691 [Toxocara canis]
MSRSRLIVLYIDYYRFFSEWVHRLVMFISINVYNRCSFMECEIAVSSYCDGHQSGDMPSELTTLCDELPTSNELPSYAFVISAMLFVLISAEMVMILFALWIKYTEDKWWEHENDSTQASANSR